MLLGQDDLAEVPVDAETDRNIAIGIRIHQIAADYLAVRSMQGIANACHAGTAVAVSITGKCKVRVCCSALAFAAMRCALSTVISVSTCVASLP